MTLTVPDSQALFLGKELSGYQIRQLRIEKLIAEGGMGCLYEAKHVKLGRTWAVKVANLSTVREAKELFEQEAMVTATLREYGDRRVVEVADIGELPDQRPYMVMEFIRGKSLEQQLNETPKLPIDQALEIIESMSETLERAHDLGFIHRDIKPANIMLEQSYGRKNRDVRVLDWGVASGAGENREAVTGAGSAVGTPGYMSPEAFMGDATDGRADVFSAATMLYEMICGQRAFQGVNAMQVMVATTNFHPSPLASLIQGFPQELSDIIATGMTKDRQYRPNMRVFRTALCSLMADTARRRAAGAPTPLSTTVATAPDAPANAEPSDFTLCDIEEQEMSG